MAATDLASMLDVVRLQSLRYRRTPLGAEDAFGVGSLSLVESERIYHGDDLRGFALQRSAWRMTDEYRKLCRTRAVGATSAEGAGKVLTSGTGRLGVAPVRLSGTGTVTCTGTGAVTTSTVSLTGAGYVLAAGVIGGSGAVTTSTATLSGAGNIDKMPVVATVGLIAPTPVRILYSSTPRRGLTARRTT